MSAISKGVQGDFRLATLNVTSLRNHYGKVVLIDVDALALQETALTEWGQKK